MELIKRHTTTSFVEAMQREAGAAHLALLAGRFGMKTQPWGTGDFIAISAMRYAMGRRSYIVGMTTEWIRWHWSDFGKEARGTMKRDLREEIERTDRIPGNLGMDFDEREWRNLYAFMEQSIK